MIVNVIVTQHHRRPSTLNITQTGRIYIGCIVDNFGSFWLVLSLVVAVFGWFWIVLAGFVGGFWWFWQVPCFSNYAPVSNIPKNSLT